MSAQINWVCIVGALRTFVHHHTIRKHLCQHLKCVNNEECPLSVREERGFGRPMLQTRLTVLSASRGVRLQAINGEGILVKGMCNSLWRVDRRVPCHHAHIKHDGNQYEVLKPIRFEHLDRLTSRLFVHSEEAE